MALLYEVDRFSKLSGEDWKHTSIGRIGAFLDGYKTALGSIEDEPVIRCKDCKHYWDSAGICVMREFSVSNSIEPDDYCSRAERRTDELGITN